MDTVFPELTNQKEEAKPAHVDMSIEADGTVLWNGTAVDDAALRVKTVQAAQADPQPELHLNADRKVAYEKVAQAMSAAKSGGLTKLGFVTNPARR
ncbi:ExbD/TolR family protein [Paraburkholderia fynbosensis]|uniref:Tol-Pal system protein TolR n=1 Tax=Paraburkholderia fynbosensis TaxID=1200993 RepID=A0A6J5GZM8_9BURK|nr:biopolymer transporter ExbD [Paraburkholderia fynbosensis]CAB3809972.1 Tol-Pal system protein TolR [Paraburkholderia fynbosensis]